MSDTEPIFFGSSEYSMDDKFRVSLPQDFRNRLKGQFVITCGPHGSLLLVVKEDWETLEKQVLSMPFGLLDRGAALVARSLLGGKHEVSADASGKFVISRFLRDWAQLDTGTIVYVVGAGRYIEVWNRDHFRQHCRDAANNDAWYAAVETLSAAKAA
jgi:MraZ protein